ncbi:MAG: hypothetical protein D6784_14600 [Chloroflexi bacterium]|nr:MAG: hypothetical protein D6784_14600 [Chloroflexota bacterium]
MPKFKPGDTAISTRHGRPTTVTVLAVTEDGTCQVQAEDSGNTWFCRPEELQELPEDQRLSRLGAPRLPGFSV